MNSTLRRSRGSVAVALLCTMLMVVVAVGAVMVGSLVGTAPASAQSDDTSTTTAETDEQSPAGNILPRPGSGEAPDSPNDPGGWQQYLVFGAIFAGLGLIVALVVRESRRAKAATRT